MRSLRARLVSESGWGSGLARLVGKSDRGVLQLQCDWHAIRRVAAVVIGGVDVLLVTDKRPLCRVWAGIVLAHVETEAFILDSEETSTVGGFL